MCGICGYYQLTPQTSAEQLTAMADSLRHRGPDGTGIWTKLGHPCGLGHVRLAIIDLAGGAQPMQSTDERFVIAFNGEIYNYPELRQELSDRGHVFATHSDTEIILEAYRAWGRECLQRFRGMFAFALYDTQTKSLFLARDRTGIKPLYYHPQPDGGIVFGSEIKAVMRQGNAPRRLNPEALVDYLCLGYPLVPNTCFRDVFELEPGTWLEVSPRGKSQGRFWSWSRSPAAYSEELALELAKQAISDSLKEHLIADVPIAAFLSGGIDSSLLVATLVQELGVRIATFHVRFADAQYDESSYARQVAEHLGTEHHEIIVEDSRADIELVEKVLDWFDQPFADSSAIPSYLVCQAIRQHVKVAIGGDGGDEMFGGYPRFYYADVAKGLGKLPHFCLSAAMAMAGASGRLAPTAARKSTRLLSAAAARNGARLMWLSTYSDVKQVRQILAPDIAAVATKYSPSLLAHNASVDPGGNEFIEATVRYALPGDYLRKVDMMSSAHGLEVRVPFLGEHVLRFSSRLPTQFLYNRRIKKPLLRKLGSQRLPQKVATKRKTGFEIPLDTWLGPLGRRIVADKLTSPHSLLSGVVKPSYTKQLVDSFVSQDWDRSQASRFNLYQRVYMLWSLNRWLENWRPCL